MKAISIFLFTLLFIVSCGENQGPQKNNTAKQSSAKQNSNIESFYELYEPKNIKLPNILFIVIDAHADVNLALNRFQYTSNNYGFRILALKNVKNNTLNFESKIQYAIDHAKENFEFSTSQIYLAGFSGGARMALKYARSHDVKGVIMIGAGPQEHNTSFPFSVALITGTKDFNFIEQYYPITSPQVQNPNLISLHWKGKHEWPDSSIIDEATSFILYASSAIEEKEIDRDNQILKAKKAQTDKDLYLYFKQLELISKTTAGPLKGKAEASIKSIQNSSNAQSYFGKLNTILVEEQTRNQQYIKDIDMNTLDWWESTITDLNKKIEANKALNADSYSRSKAFLGILLYSKVSQGLTGNGNVKLVPKYLSIYELLEPDNPDLFFFKALYAYNLSDNQKAIDYLKSALNLGFNDIQKMQQHFPAMLIKAAQGH